MPRRQACLSFLLLLIAACGIQSTDPVSQVDVPKGPWSRVPTVVVVAPENDPRLPAMHEAIDFWNRMVAEIGTPFRLGPVLYTTAEISTDYLQMLSVQVLSREGHAAFPAHIRRLPGDIIVVLSDGDFVSFSARAPSGGKVVVGMKSHRLYPLTLPNVARNLIAHELGHFRLHRGVAIHIDEDFRVNLRDEDSSKGVSWEEVEANRFAAELLMPTGFLFQDVEKFKNIDKQAVQNLARRYRVSSQSMEIRLANLGFTPRV